MPGGLDSFLLLLMLVTWFSLYPCPFWLLLYGIQSIVFEILNYLILRDALCDLFYGFLKYELLDGRKMEIKQVFHDIFGFC